MANPGPEFPPNGHFDASEIDLESLLSGNQRGGRPKKEVTLEKLLSCKDYTRKAAAAELKVSESTLGRRMKELTGCKTWSEFRESPSVSRVAHGRERRQDMDEAVIIVVNYGGDSRPFHLAAIEEETQFQQLQNLIEQNFNLEARAYSIKYNNLTISCNNCLKACFVWASKFQFTHILLTVENH